MTCALLPQHVAKPSYTLLNAQQTLCSQVNQPAQQQQLTCTISAALKPELKYECREALSDSLKQSPQANKHLQPFDAPLALQTLWSCSLAFVYEVQLNLHA